MDLLDFELENTPRLSTVKPGEYNLRCKKVEVKQSKNGKPMLTFLFDIPSEAASYDVRHNIMLPVSDGPDRDEDKERIRKLNRLRDIYEALGVPINEKDPSAFEGRECWAILEETSSPEYGDQNNIRKFIKRK